MSRPTCQTRYIFQHDLKKRLLSLLQINGLDVFTEGCLSDSSVTRKCNEMWRSNLINTQPNDSHQRLIQNEKHKIEVFGAI